MFSALFSAQNRPVLIININSATFQYSNDGTRWNNIPSNGMDITYDSLNYQVRVLSVDPADATYSSSIPLPISQQGQTAQAVITGTGSYTGSIISPNLTISASAINIAPSDSTSFSYNGSVKTLGYIVSGVYEADTNYAVSETSSTNAGSYTATLTTTSSNYVLGTTTNIPWTISKAIITLTTNNLSMTYGSSVPTQSFAYSLSGLLGGDTASVITGIAPRSTTATSSSNVGSYPITTNISGLSATNYTFATVTGTLTISPATLAATGTTGSATYTGSSQTVTVISGVNGTFSGSRDVTAAVVGTHTTTINGTGNYTGSVTGSFTIGKATLTITTNNASMTYGSSVPAFAYTPSGFVNSETAAVISGTVSHATTGTSSSNVGTYVITPSVSSLSATNYTFTPANGTLTISPATLSATGTTGSATYTGSSQTVTVISGVNGTFSGSRDVTAAVVGTHTTTINGTGNYTGSVTGSFTIGKATLTITTNNASMTYGSSVPAFTYTPTGFVNSETAAVISGTVSHTTTGTSSSSVGTYVITPSVSNLSATNYTFTPANGTLTINQATLAASTTTSPYAVYNRQQQSFTISGINGTYTGNPAVSGTNAGSYSTTIYGTGNYTGSVTGTLTIYQDVGYVDIFYGGVHDASRTSSIFVPVRTSNAAFTVTHSVSGPGAADAQYTSYGLNSPYDWNMLYDPVPPGTVVRNTNPYTQGFVVTITAAINDPNYGFMSSTTSVTVNAYVAPSGGGGFVTE